MKIPKHLAIIMDGNGRWAEQHHRPRVYGHVKGTRVAKKIIQECSRLGVKYLTLYAFSTENWLRPQAEVTFLMTILRRYLKRETQNLIKENIRFTVIGEIDRLPADVVTSVSAAMAATEKCTGLNLVFAISYGSKQEITNTVKQIAKKVASGELKPDQIDEATIHTHLATAGTPNPDLILRTSGEQRLSNFLLWQAAYSEFYFTNQLWPDFTESDLKTAFEDFANRQRRFGKVVQENEATLN
ncbi:MAG: isoprenyl transferase [Bdellovibrionaceae bacterium]|nr:isoprenyl transferase [Pseudobdellovibrionaceae bacterium]